MVGKIMRARLNPPDMIDHPIPRIVTKKINPNKPNIIEGTPARQSVPKRISLVTLDSRVNSTRYTEVQIPKGAATMIANTGNRIVPISIGNIPPDLPISDGLVKRKLKLKIGKPFSSTKIIMKIRIATVKAVAAPRIVTAPICVYFGETLISLLLSF
jgi:hypothetical protein